MRGHDRERYALVEAGLVLPEVVHERARDDAVRKRPRPKADADLRRDPFREDFEVLELKADNKRQLSAPVNTSRGLLYIFTETTSKTHKPQKFQRRVGIA